MRIWWGALVIALGLSLVANVVLVIGALRGHHDSMGYLEMDAPLVQRMITDYAKEVGAPTNDLMRSRFPISIYLDDRKCFTLQLKKGYIGFQPVYCFRRSDDALVYKRVRQM